MNPNKNNRKKIDLVLLLCLVIISIFISIYIPVITYMTYLFVREHYVYNIIINIHDILMDEFSDTIIEEFDLIYKGFFLFSSGFLFLVIHHLFSGMDKKKIYSEKTYNAKIIYIFDFMFYSFLIFILFITIIFFITIVLEIYIIDLYETEKHLEDYLIFLENFFLHDVGVFYVTESFFTILSKIYNFIEEILKYIK